MASAKPFGSSAAAKLQVEGNVWVTCSMGTLRGTSTALQTLNQVSHLTETVLLKTCSSLKRNKDRIRNCTTELC